MNADEDYGFDIAGFIHLHRVLTAEEVNRCSQAIDAVGREEGLLEWPTPGASRSGNFSSTRC